MTDEPDRRGRDGWRARLPLGELPLETETAAFLLASVLDIVLTTVLLAAGGFRESNAVADWFIAGWGVKGMVWFKMTLAAVVCVLAQVVATKKPRWGRGILLLGTGVTGAVVLYSAALAFLHL